MAADSTGWPDREAPGVLGAWSISGSGIWISSYMRDQRRSSMKEEFIAYQQLHSPLGTRSGGGG